LEGIIEQDDIDVARLVAGEKGGYAAAAVAVDGDDGIRELLFHLPGLIADDGHRCLDVSQMEAVRLAFVATAEHGDAMVGKQ